MKLLKSFALILSLASGCTPAYAYISAGSNGEKVNASLFKTVISLNNVENTALSTWAGSANLTTLGTVGTGTWQGTSIADAYLASAATWNAKQSALTFGAGLTNTAGTIAIDSTVATLTGTQTLTNKTLTSAILNTPVIADAALSIEKTSGLQTALDGKLGNIGPKTFTQPTDNTGLTIQSGNYSAAAFRVMGFNALPIFSVTDSIGEGVVEADNLILNNAATIGGTLNVAGAITGPGTGLTGTAASLTVGNAATVTTNANLTGVVTSTGNATAIADAALSIAKTSGLQTALDGKATAPLTASAALDYPNILAQTEETLTITVTGAATTNTPSVALGWSAVLPDAIVVKQAWVSAADTISIRVRNGNTVTAIDPASVTCRATVFNN